ncbi:MAG: hypothetical protein PF570_07025 [Candidatus Cloacimonetes bacterium]|jgi:hypothetical protein|nr:hypothetical protein [Candidatus Cloacimonadota bacterium]
MIQIQSFDLRISKIFIILFILFLISPIFAKNQKREYVFVVSPTTGIFSGIRVGFGLDKKYENHIWELTLNYKSELISHVAGPKITFKSMNSSFFDSIYLQANKFWNLEKKKSFLILKVGFFLMPPLSFATDSGVDSDNNVYFCPLITVGYGYSFKVSRKINFQPSLDIGLQSNLINVGLAFTF